MMYLLVDLAVSTVRVAEEWCDPDGTERVPTSVALGLNAKNTDMDLRNGWDHPLWLIEPMCCQSEIHLHTVQYTIGYLKPWTNSNY
jgi:hypothetical protein